MLHLAPTLKKSITYWKEISKKEKDQWLETLIVDSFKLFTSETLPRISENQLVEYGLSTLVQNGMVCEMDEFESDLELFAQGKTDKYRYVRTISEADRGYISEVKK